MTLDNLVNEQGALVETLPKLERESIQHADEINAARITDEALRHKWFYTADFPLYKIERGNEILRLARGKYNLIFDYPEEAASQLRETRNFVPEKKDITRVVRAQSTLKVVLPALELARYNDEFGYFKVGTSPRQYEKLTPERKKLVGRVFGEGAKGKKYLKLLKDSGINSTRIYALMPDYVKKTIEEKKVPALARAGWLSGFGNSSSFDADVRSIGNPGIRLRGVRCASEASPKSPEGRDAREKDASRVTVPDYEQVLEIVLPRVPEVLHEETRRDLGKLYKR